MNSVVFPLFGSPINPIFIVVWDYSGRHCAHRRAQRAARSLLSQPADASRASVGLREVDLSGALIALLVSVFWGANPVAIKVGLGDAPPLRLAWMRFALGGSLVVLWAIATGRLRDVSVKRAEWWPLLHLGLLFTLQIAIMNIGTSMTSASHATILLNTYAVHTAVLAHFVIPGDRLTPRRLLGVLVAYGGTVALFIRQTSGGAPTLFGDAVVMVSAVLLAERTVYLARVVRTIDPVKLLLAQAAIGTAIFVALSTVLEPAPTRWTAPLAASVVYQGAVVSGFNFVVNLWLLQRYRPSGLAAFFLTQPLFGVMIAAAITGDRLTPDLLIAAVALAVGIGLSLEWRRETRRSRAAARRRVYFS